jgi:hypothetical protein
MSEPTYGSGPSYGQGYGPAYEQQPYGQQQGAGPYGTGQQPQQPQQPQYGGGYGQQPAPAGPGGYHSAGAHSAGAPTPSAPPATPADRGALLAQIVTYVGYLCAGAGLLGFILSLASDASDGAGKFANALLVLITGIGFGGINIAAGTWLGQKQDG